MNKLVLFNKNNLNNSLSKRAGESKFGEHVQVIANSENIYEQLVHLDVDYVLFGIPEDVGVFANNGRSGTYTAWNATLNVLLNIQSNAYTRANRVLILGQLDFSEEVKLVSNLKQSKQTHIKKARRIVNDIDKHVSSLIHTIVKAGKTPIVIGGGHNNAYGNIKGTSLALKKKINVINLDAHTDLRDEEGRHSGNGFTYALSEGFLGHYFVFGLHENYTSQNILNRLNDIKNTIEYNTFEALFIRKELKFKAECKRALDHISKSPFGIEIDCDAIEHIASSAMTPSGLSVNKTREFLHYFASHKNATYLHICEAAPGLAPKKLANQTAKLITYLITDFIRAHGR